MSLTDHLRAFQGKTIAVVGDLMLDEYISGKIERINPEAPVMVVHEDPNSHRHVPGGAANVALNIVRLGGRPLLVGVVGEDPDGYTLARELDLAGVCSSSLVWDENRLTTRKSRVVVQGQQVIRLDVEERGRLSALTQGALTRRVKEAIAGCDAVVVSDYRKGCITPERTSAIRESASKLGLPVLANPKPKSLAWYRGYDLISINRAEAEGFVLRDDLPPDKLIKQVHANTRKADIRNVLITLGEQGMILAAKAIEQIPALHVEVYDTAGAGDTVIATMALAAAASLDWPTAARIANLAAGCVVRHRGVAVPTPCEMETLAQMHNYSV